MAMVLLILLAILADDNKNNNVDTNSKAFGAKAPIVAVLINI